MLSRFREFADDTRLYRRAFGQVRGSRIALRMRDWRYPQGSLYTVKVPGIRHPIHLRAGSSDKGIFGQMFLKGFADFPVRDRPRLIVDAGANVGLTSVVLTNRYPRARVVSLELDRSNFKVLWENTKRYPLVSPRNVGLWSRSCRLDIEDPADGHEASFRAVERVDGPIEAVGVQDLIDECGPIDLLKIDIEGGETTVFRGDCPWLDYVHVLAIELHDRLVPGCREAVDRALAGRGFVESACGEYVVFSRR